MKRIPSLRVTVAIVLAASAGPALAQRGVNYGQPLDNLENNLDLALRRAAFCIDRNVPATARRILASDIGSDEEAKRVRSAMTAGRDCFPDNRPRFNPTSFRNMVAESEYMARHRITDPEASRTGPVPLPATFSVQPAGVDGRPEQRVAWQLAAIARCTVFVDPAKARQLIIGPRNVPEEDRRFAELSPAIGKCVEPRTASQLKARDFRGFIADALLARAGGSGR